jgi:hypothetical protein
MNNSLVFSMWPGLSNPTSPYSLPGQKECQQKHAIEKAQPLFVGPQKLWPKVVQLESPKCPEITKSIMKCAFSTLFEEVQKYC